MQNKSKMHWLVVIATCGLMISGVGFPDMSTGVFITPMAESLGVLRGNVALHSTLSLLVKGVAALYVPILLEKFSFKKIITVGVVITAVTNFLLGLSSEIWLFNLLGIIRGTGAGLISYLTLTLIINEWFEKKHGLVMSIVMSFSSISGAVFSPFFTWTISLWGWQLSYQLMGVLTILFALPALLMPFGLDPRDSGYLPYGYEEQKDVSQESVGTISEGVLEKVPALAASLFMVFALLQTALTVLPQHFTGFASSIGLTANFGATLASVTMLTAVIIKLVVGSISDWIGSIKTTVLMMALSFVGLLLLVLAKGNVSLLVGASIFGAVYSIPSVCVPLLTKEFFGNQLFAKLYAKVSFAIMVGSSVAISAIGYIYDFTGTYATAFILGIIILFLNLGILIYLTKKHMKSHSEAPIV